MFSDECSVVSPHFLRLFLLLLLISFSPPPLALPLRLRVEADSRASSPLFCPPSPSREGWKRGSGCRSHPSVRLPRRDPISSRRSSNSNPSSSNSSGPPRPLPSWHQNGIEWAGDTICFTRWVSAGCYRCCSSPILIICNILGVGEELHNSFGAKETPLINGIDLLAAI